MRIRSQPILFFSLNRQQTQGKKCKDQKKKNKTKKTKQKQNKKQKIKKPKKLNTRRGQLCEDEPEFPGGHGTPQCLRIFTFRAGLPAASEQSSPDS